VLAKCRHPGAQIMEVEIRLPPDSLTCAINDDNWAAITCSIASDDM
jgi:hypothetical protein